MQEQGLCFTSFPNYLPQFIGLTDFWPGTQLPFEITEGC